MLESVCEHPFKLPRRHVNETDLSLSEQQKLTGTYVQYYMRLRHVRENPTFEPVFLQPWCWIMIQSTPRPAQTTSMKAQPSEVQAF